MNNRVAISKKLRFEVFKRDKFTCQYCGKQAPNVILEADHINPVSKGGTNELLNLTTSCYDCNRGKTNTKLDDDSVVVKQRKQLELLQERREQIDLMFQWKNELNKIDGDITDMVIDYIDNKIDNFSLNDSGKLKIAAFTKKYGLADILESVDISATKYLRYDSEGNLTQESVEDFINKIGGILFNKNKSPVEQKLSYIKGICRNRIYWNDRNGSIILNNYAKALRNYGWIDDRILKDLDEELIPKTKEARNWTEWRELVEQWTEDVKKWHAQEEAAEHYEVSEEESQECAILLYEKQKDIIPALTHLGKAFNNFDESALPKYIDAMIQHYLTAMIGYYKLPNDQRTHKPSIRKSGYESGLFHMYGPVDNMLTFYLDDGVLSVMEAFFDEAEVYRNVEVTCEHFEIILEKYRSLVAPSDEKA